MKKLLAILLAVALLCCAVPFAFAAPADAPLMDGAKLVTFGDSITALSTWPYSVGERVNMQVINEGIGGNTSEQGRARFERDVMAHDPDFVIISFGTNDFYPETGSPRVSIARYKENLTYFINSIKNIGGTPILMTPPFMAPDALGPDSMYPEGSSNLALDKFVAAMREVASSTGTHLIDIHTVCDGYNTNSFLISDGLHLAELGNQVYTNTIVSYLQANFRQDPSAPRVTTNNPPAVDYGTWTKDLVPRTADGWLVLFPGTASAVDNADGSVTLVNQTGKWPELHYSPQKCDMFYAPIENSYLTIDMELDAAANISLYYDGPSPTREYAHTDIPLSPILDDNFDNIGTDPGGDIHGGQHVRVTLPLSNVVPERYIHSDGTALFSGVKIFVSGAYNSTVKFNEFSITHIASTPKHKDNDSLLPTSTSAISQNEGKVDFTLASNRLTIARAAASDIAWPSIKVNCNKTVDLSKTPFLHLNVTTAGGQANGYIRYTTAGGASGEVQISQLISGTPNDVASATDVYVNLAKAIGSHRTVTITDYTLSVYGVAGDAVTWNTIATARDASGEYMLGDIDGNEQLTTSDAMYTLQHTLGIIKLEGAALAAADYDGNGAVNTADARDILRATL